MIISICNEKGGSGKSNIAINLATKLGLDKYEVLLVDTDPQKTTEVFSIIRADNELPLIYNSVSKRGSGLVKELKSLEQKYDVLIIDTGGRDSDEMRQALVVSDIVIVPTIPSEPDVAVLNRMIKTIKESAIINSELKTLFVISKASPNPFLESKIESLKEYIREKELENAFLLNSVIYEREAYKSAFSQGKGIVEYCTEKDRAYQDFNNFVSEIADILTSINKE